jgi:hypothetical protein
MLRPLKFFFRGRQVQVGLLDIPDQAAAIRLDDLGSAANHARAPLGVSPKEATEYKPDESNHDCRRRQKDVDHGHLAFSMAG